MAEPPASLDLARTLARTLQALTRGLLFPSESDYPYKAFAAPLARGAAFDAESFRAAAGIGRRYVIRVDDARQFFEDRIHPIDGDDADVPRYQLLKTVMDATLTQVSRIWVGGENVVHVRVYIVGRMEDGNLAGLSTVSIET